MAERSRAFLAFLVTLALLVALVPQPALADDTKVDPDVLRQLAFGGTAEVMVDFTEQADTAAVAAVLSGSARKAAVVAELQRSSARVLAPAKAALDRNGTTYIGYWADNAMSVSGATRKDVDDLSALPGVKRIRVPDRVELDATSTGAATPTVVSSVDAATRTGPSCEPQWNLAYVRAPEAWKISTGAGITVGLIDTGVFWEHPDLRPGYRQIGPDHRYSWRDFHNLTYDPTAPPFDPNGHGTHTTGTVAGRNCIGVAPDASWIAAKAIPGTEPQVRNAMQWMMAPGGDPAYAPDVVSNSWGSTRQPPGPYAQIITNWVNAGIVPVFSNGNAGPGASTVGYPALLRQAYGVGSLDSGIYSGIALRALPNGPGPFIATSGSGPPPPSLTAGYRFVGQACGPIKIDLTGLIALVERGGPTGCDARRKHDNVRASGGVALVIFNSLATGSPLSISGTPADGIPALAVTREDGILLRDFEPTPGAQLRLDPSKVLTNTPYDPPIVSPFSSRGPSPDGGVVKPQVSAPGTNIRSSWPTSLKADGYTTISGTSMSGPHVGGLAALVRAVNPALTVAQVREIMDSTANPIGQKVPNNDVGFGMIDAYGAVVLAGQY